MKKKYLIYLFLIISMGCEEQGPEGKISLIDFIIEPIGDNCPSGGYKIISGIDQNNNNILDRIEIENTEYICNGNNGDGFNSLVDVIIEPIGDNCLSGGYKVLTGLDSNRNGLLDEDEVLNTQYICNGDDGINTLFSIIVEEPGDNCTAGGYKLNYGKDLNNNGILDENEIDDYIFICNGVNGSGDIETRISLEWWANTTSTTPIMGIGISGFNKDNYPGVDSIVFVGIPYSGNISNNSIVDLYDFTADQVIPGSELKSNKDGATAEELYTINLYNVIPSGSRDLGIRLRSEIEGEFSGTLGKCSLYLYRR